MVRQASALRTIASNLCIIFWPLLLQNRVEQNLQRINELKAEAARLARQQQQAQQQGQAAPRPAPAAAPAAAAAAAAGGNSSPAAAAAAAGSKAAKQFKRGLCSSLDFEDGLRNYWCAGWPAGRGLFCQGLRKARGRGAAPRAELA